MMKFGRGDNGVMALEVIQLLSAKKVLTVPPFQPLISLIPYPSPCSTMQFPIVHFQSYFICASATTPFLIIQFFPLPLLSSASSSVSPSISFSSCDQRALRVLGPEGHIDMCSTVSDGCTSHHPKSLGVKRNNIWCQGSPQHSQVDEWGDSRRDGAC